MAETVSNTYSKIAEDNQQIHEAEGQHSSKAHLGFLWSSLAADYRAVNDFSHAEDAYIKSISLLKSTPETTLNYATALDNLGALYLMYGKGEAAANYMERALAIRRQLNDPLPIAASLQHLAQLHVSLHRFKDAERDASQTYQILTATNAPATALISVLDTLAYSRCQQNSCAQGIIDAGHAVDMARTGPDSLQYGLTLITLGFAQSRTHQLDVAEKSILTGLRIVQAHTAPDDPTLLTSMLAYRDYLKAAHRNSEASQVEAQLAAAAARHPCASCTVSVQSLSKPQ